MSYPSAAQGEKKVRRRTLAKILLQSIWFVSGHGLSHAIERTMKQFRPNAIHMDPPGYGRHLPLCPERIRRAARSGPASYQGTGFSRFFQDERSRRAELLSPARERWVRWG